MKYIIGIDEVGRGPLAGPVTVCAVLCEEEVYKNLKKDKTLPKVGRDSKKLSPKQREEYSEVIKRKKIKYSIVHISNKVIDKKGVSFAIKSAIKKCLDKLEIRNLKLEIILDGGLKAPIEFKSQKTIIKGDEKEKIIAWASILAKVSRDKLMEKSHKKYPKYDFHIHKGYGTRLHRESIKKNGLSEIHRMSFCKNFV